MQTMQSTLVSLDTMQTFLPPFLYLSQPTRSFMKVVVDFLLKKATYSTQRVIAKNQNKQFLEDLSDWSKLEVDNS